MEDVESTPRAWFGFLQVGGPFKWAPSTSSWSAEIVVREARVPSLLIAPRLEDAHCGRVIRQGNMGKFYRTRDNRVGPLVLPQNGRAGLAQRDVKG